MCYANDPMQDFSAFHAWQHSADCSDAASVATGGTPDASWWQPTCAAGRGVGCSDNASMTTDTTPEEIWSFTEDLASGSGTVPVSKDVDEVEMLVIKGLECFSWEATSPAAVAASLRSGELS